MKQFNILTLPILVLAYGVFSDDPAASLRVLGQFQELPSWFTNLWILVPSVYGIKGTQIPR